jgi:uncharacterized protein (UPF0297 family)
MSGKQVYITKERHAKLKVASLKRNKSMGELVGEQIDDMEVDNWEELASELVHA